MTRSRYNVNDRKFDRRVHVFEDNYFDWPIILFSAYLIIQQTGKSVTNVWKTLAERKTGGRGNARGRESEGRGRVREQGSAAGKERRKDS